MNSRGTYLTAASDLSALAAPHAHPENRGARCSTPLASMNRWPARPRRNSLKAGNHPGCSAESQAKYFFWYWSCRLEGRVSDCGKPSVAAAKGAGPPAAGPRSTAAVEAHAAHTLQRGLASGRCRVASEPPSAYLLNPSLLAPEFPERGGRVRSLSSSSPRSSSWPSGNSWLSARRFQRASISGR